MLNQLRVGRAARCLRYLCFGLVTCLLINASAWGANHANKLVAVSVEAASATPTVLIETAEPVGYRYTVYDSIEPTRVVIDFPGMEVAGVAEALAVNQGAVQEVRVAGFTLASGQLSRVEILLAENSEYQIKLDGKQFRVAFAAARQIATSPAAAADQAGSANASAPPAEEPGVATPATTPAAQAVVEPARAASAASAQDASVLRNVTLSAGRALIESNGRITKSQHFPLSNPPRLVVDVYGVRPEFKERVFAAAGGFKALRIGSYQDKTRLVFDASTNLLPEYQVEAGATDILVTWSASTAASGSQGAAAPAVSEPSRVASAPAAPAKAAGAANVEAIDFSNENGRSVITVTLSAPAKIVGPLEEGKLVRFEIVNANISRALRRTIDASAFPSAVTSVTPYTVSEGDGQNVRIAVDLKGPVAYALEQDGVKIRLVVDDGAYAEPLPPAVSQRLVAAPKKGEERSGFAAAPLPLPVAPAISAKAMAVEAERYTGEKITLVFDSANVRSILQLIGDVSGLNILASSDVKGDITLRLIDVPWDQALDLVLETADLGKVQQGNVLRIMPKDKIREIEQADMREQIVAIEEGVLETRTFAISYASVNDMKGFLADIQSARGSIIADARNKQLIVRDVASVLAQMQDMIGQIDMPERQVMIEARIVEANTNFSRNLGVKWNFDYQENDANGNGVDSIRSGLGGAFLIPVTNPASAGFGTAIGIGALDDQLNIDLRLSALETSGEGKIVSTPRITTLNGEKAIISQGTKIPFSTVSDSGTDVTFENAELKLEVTPEINPDGSILLQINASNSAVGTVVPTATGDAVSIDEKKAETRVLVRDGQTTVIGGIFIEDERDLRQGVPVLMHIPVFGHLFKSTTKTRDRRELLIFITPRIVES